MLHLFLKPAHLPVETCYIFFEKVLCVFEKDATSSSRQELLIDGGIWILIDTVTTYFFTITKSRKQYDIKKIKTASKKKQSLFFSTLMLKAGLEVQCLLDDNIRRILLLTPF